MRIKVYIFIVIFSILLLVGSGAAYAQSINYNIIKGDTIYKIAKRYGVTTNEILRANNISANSVIYPGQKIIIPVGTAKPYITYISYYVKANDTLWSIGSKFGIPMTEVMQNNNLKESSVLYNGQKLSIPVHHVPIMPTPGATYGEYLDWWTQAQYVLPIGSVFEITDFYTGKSFMAKRTTGANHADVEPLTYSDTQRMKAIWGGVFSWKSRAVLVKYKGRTIAASAAGYPHAGNDAAPGGVYSTWRSGDYGAGENFDWVKYNGMDGVFDLHFKNSTNHVDGKVNIAHQANINLAAGK